MSRIPGFYKLDRAARRGPSHSPGVSKPDLSVAVEGNAMIRVPK